MASIWDLFVSLKLDSSNFSKGIDGAVTKSNSAGSSIVGNLTAIGGTAVLGALAAAGAGVAAVGAFMASTIKPASDLNESINAINVVFGSGSAAILKYGENAAQTIGLSNTAFNGLATTTGAFLQNVGFNADRAGKETIKLTERAADMASVFNTDVAQAMAAIQSGLKGEFNPLEQFGVKINAAQIEAKALAMGLNVVPAAADKMAWATNNITVQAKAAADALAKYGEGSKEAKAATKKLGEAQGWAAYYAKGEKVALTDSMKAAAALELVYEQTSKTQGDFSNTSEGLANLQRRLGATFENVKAKIGTALLPGITKIASTMNKWLTDPAVISGLEKMAGGVADFAGKAIAYIPVVISWFQQAKTTVGNIQTAIGNFLTTIAGWWAENGAAITAVVSGAWAQITTMFDAGKTMVMTLVSGLVGRIRDYWNEHSTQIIATVNMMWSAIQNVFTTVTGVITGIFNAFTALFTGDFEAFKTALLSIWDAAWLGIRTAAEIAWGVLLIWFPTQIQAVLDFFLKTDWGAAGRAMIDGIWSALQNGWGWLMDQVRALAQSLLAAAMGGLNAGNVKIGANGAIIPTTPQVPGGPGGGNGNNYGGAGNVDRGADMMVGAQSERVDYQRIGRELRDAVLLVAR